MDAVLSCMVSEKLGPGDLSKTLIREVSAYIGIAEGYALREPKTALGLTLDAMGVGRGDSAVISPLAPAVYYDVLLERGIEVLFADVDPNTACIDPVRLERLIPKNPAICIVDSPLGYVPDVMALAEFKVPLVEDISNCLGAISTGGKAGRFGRFTLVNLEEHSIITAGGGSLVLSQTKRDLGELRKAGSHLHEASLLPDLNASLALEQLRNIEELIGKRRDIAQIFHRALMKGRHRTLSQDGDNENVFFSFPVMLDGSVKEGMKYARSKNVITQEAFHGSILPRMAGDPSQFPNAQGLYLRCILFPLYPMLGKAHIQEISRVLSTLP